jgi:hypothetical protein
MRHPGNSIALRVSLGILAATCGLTGCGAEGSNPNDVVVEIRDEAGMLRKVRSASEFEGLDGTASLVSSIPIPGLHSDPRIAGQLAIPGFSDFLHPVTENLLLVLEAPSSQVTAGTLTDRFLIPTGLATEAGGAPATQVLEPF